ncbi:GSCFA domain-containing protein, partial [bacterium]|nr:GSCFA domain-containing protein [bacterium]
MLRMFKNIAQANRPEVGVPKPVRYSTGVPNEYYRDFVSSGEFRNPKKTLLRDGDTVFTMGSCFANEIRAYLQTHQLADTRPQVPAAALPSFHDRSKEISSWGEWDGTSNLQFYNTFSIRQEIEKSVGGWTQSPNDFWQVEIGGETLYQCPYRRRIFAKTPEALNRITILIDEEIKASLK